mmetsp:Transcript_10158/g.24846  ORF Transcript_10158/g.24846 Transcript_10158/m.24846 type:complete len:214 (+) Transcript_10158:957-1598(+)
MWTRKFGLRRPKCWQSLRACKVFQLQVNQRAVPGASAHQGGLLKAQLMPSATPWITAPHANVVFVKKSHDQRDRQTEVQYREDISSSGPDFTEYFFFSPTNPLRGVITHHSPGVGTPSRRRHHHRHPPLPSRTEGRWLSTNAPYQSQSCQASSTMTTRVSVKSRVRLLSPPLVLHVPPSPQATGETSSTQRSVVHSCLDNTNRLRLHLKLGRS